VENAKLEKAGPDYRIGNRKTEKRGTSAGCGKRGTEFYETPKIQEQAQPHSE